MKRFFLLLSFVMMGVCAAMAQAPEKMTYQAVVRNSGNSLVANQNVSVRLSILQGSAQGAPVYVENHTATTNDNGLMTVVVGGGAPTTGVFASIDWASGPYFLKSEIDPTGGINYSIESVQQLMSVPYALYAKQAGNGFSGDYNDLTNKPTFTESQILSISNDTIYLTGGSFVKLPAGFDGDYNSLINKPTNVSAFQNDAGYITKDSIPMNVSAFTNDAGYVTVANVQQAANIPTNVSAFTNDAGYITMDSIPAIPTVPTNVSAFTNDAGYITQTAVPTNVSAFTNDAGYLTSFTESQILSVSNDTIYLTGGSFVKLPAGFDGDYNSLTNKPTIPIVPTDVSAFQNDAGYITQAAVPTNMSQLQNDAGYLTSFTESQILSISNDTIYLTGGSFVKLPAGFDGDYNSLTNKPTIPIVPTDVSVFNNDAGYITMDSIPTIPTVPTNVSAFTNDAGYITKDSIPAGLEGSQTGDIMYWNADSSSWVMMPAGTSGQVLTVKNGIPVWANLPDYASLILPPTVTTSNPLDVTQSSALCGGEVNGDGNVQLTACGVCWSTHHSPTIADAHTSNDLSVSAFTNHITNLTHKTTYYVRAYATNSIGTTYGAEMTFTTADIPTDSLMMPNPCSTVDTNAIAQPTLAPNYLVCAGTDSVELSLGNYQYGSIQWQYSLDTISWFDIPNAFDEQLVYKPEQTQFVRAEVSYANCPPEHSEVKLLQKTPAANAGISRTVNMGDTLHLQANMEEAATGSWQILQGANGLLKTPAEAASKFYGTDSLYRLRWTLTNNCGTSSDDINVRYVQPKVSSKVVVVDTTDIIFSDSAQLAHGYYVISFSDSNIVIGDSTILVSIVNGGFLRRVDSWSMANDSTYAMYTTQASLSDLLESGVINFGGISNGDNEGGSTEENAVEDTPAQNTPRNAPMQNTSSVQNIEFLDHIPTRKELREHPEMNGKMYVMRKEVRQADGSSEDIMPEEPTRGGGTNYIEVQDETNTLDYKKINVHATSWSPFSGARLENMEFIMEPAGPVLHYFTENKQLNFGFDNVHLKITADLVITDDYSARERYLTLSDGYTEWVYLVDGTPIKCDFNYAIALQLKGPANITGEMRHKLTADVTFSRINTIYVNSPNQNSSPKPKANGSTNIELVSVNSPTTADLNVSLAATQYFKINGVEGPHATAGCKATIKYNGYSAGWQGKVSSDLFVESDLKGAKVIDSDLPANSWSDSYSSSSDNQHEWRGLHSENTYPYRMNNIGNLRKSIPTNHSFIPVVVDVYGSDDKPVRNVYVHFEPKNGSSVDENMALTNSDGRVQVNWTPGPLTGSEQYLNAYIYDGNARIVSELTFISYEPESATQTAGCANSTLQLQITPYRDGRITLLPQNGAAPYTYSMDGNNIVVDNAYIVNNPYLTIPAPTAGTHEFRVKDANGCVATKAYNVEGPVDCSSTNLGLNKQITDRTIKVQGRNGRSPYQYALDGRPYSDNNVFTSLSPDTYTVHVKDDNGCEVSEQVEVVVDNTSSQSATPCAGAETVTDVDGNVYPTLKIGTQCWMAENLRTTRYANGDAVPILYPNDSADLKSKYGLLYTWNTATGAISSGTNPSGVQGICPDGWHIPSLAEWEQLLNQPQLMDSPAKPLATRYGWMESNIVGSPGYRPYRNNDIGFNAAPAGVNFSDFGVAAWFWSAFGTDAIRARGYCFGYDRAGVFRHDDFRSRAYSVRCLRD